ncbi:TIM barrel protein [Rudaea sp.]|uniref:TIM barrel protein n=1 Tax=Rudaea sp. TaxID=2136325 RepID=UPI002ED62A5D
MLSIGNAPCSWGIYYPKDNRYTPDQYLDQVREAGYATTELGPLGFLPTDTTRLKDALAARGLALTGATHVHTLADPSTHEALLATIDQLGKLVSDAGSKHVVIMDEGNWYPPGRRGVVDEAGWTTVVGMVRDAQQRLAGEYGIAMTFHPHLGTCVEREVQIDRLLQDTEVNLCFDTGHHAAWGQDPAAYMRKVWSRIGYVHFKSVDAKVRERLVRGEIDTAQASEAGIFAPLTDGAVDVRAVMKLLAEKNYAGPCIIEQDWSPTQTEEPVTLARKNLQFLRSLSGGVQ